MPPVGQSPPSLTASQRLCMAPAFKTEPGAQDFGEGLAVFSGAHAVTSAPGLSLCSIPTGTQTGLWLERCHYKGPLLFINRSLRGRFSRKQLLLPPARFMLCCEVQSELAAVLSFSARCAIHKGSSAARGVRAATWTSPPGASGGLGPRVTLHSPMGQLGEPGRGCSVEFCLFVLVFFRFLIAEISSSITDQREGLSF